MKTTRRSWAGVCAALLLTLSLSVGDRAHAQTTPRPPEFEVDPTWPTIPNDWVLGEVTSVSVDRNDNIWVLHVPQSVPEAQRASAAPPVLEFDAAGKLLRSWGGPGNGAEWLTYGRDYAETHFSPLTQINTRNVKRLSLAWSMATDAPQGVV